MRDGATSDPAARPADGRSTGVLSTAFARLRRDPWLFVPFVVAGVMLSVGDWLRHRDPIPVIGREGLRDGQLTVEFAGYPKGVSQTSVPLESLIGLELPYLVWGIGAQSMALIVICAAGVVTIARTLAVGADLRAGVRYLAFVVGLDLFYRVLGSISVFQGMGVFGIVLLVALLYVFVRLFFVPGFLVTGETLSSAIHRSVAMSRKNGWSVCGLVLLFGIGVWFVAAVPYFGTLLSASLVAPVHAVVIAVFLEQRSPRYP